MLTSADLTALQDTDIIYSHSVDYFNVLNFTESVLPPLRWKFLQSKEESIVTGARWSEKTCKNQNALLLHTWLINTLMGSSQITRINVGKVQTQMLTFYVHYCLSSALVSFQTQKPPGEENIMVQFKTSVWPPETQLWIVRCLLWNIQCFLYLHILELGHWCGCLVAVSESVTWPKTRRLPVNMLSWRPGWMCRQLAWFLLVIQEI